MKTGWPPGLLQDDSKALSKWFASRPDARYRARQVAQAIKDAKMSKLVALTAAHEAGKDTIADYLVKQHGFHRLAFGDPVYRGVSQMFDVPEALLRDRQAKVNALDILAPFNCSNPLYRDFLHRRKVGLYDPQTSRFHLQLFGTEFQPNKNVWADEICAVILALAPEANIVITDLRAYDDLHEYLALEKVATMTSRDFSVLEIVREGYHAQSSHSSEKQIPRSLITARIHNHEGDIQNTYRSVADALAL